MKNQSNSALDCAKDYAIEQLSDELEFLKAEINAAKRNGDKKQYCSLMRLFLPALKEYVRMYGGQGDGTDELHDFIRRGV